MQGCWAQRVRQCAVRAGQKSHGAEKRQVPVVHIGIANWHAEGIQQRNALVSFNQCMQGAMLGQQQVPPALGDGVVLLQRELNNLVTTASTGVVPV